MMMPSKKGGSAPLTELRAVQEQTGKIPVELQEFYTMEIPEGFEQFYEDFLAISNRRQMSEYGASPLSFQEIDCWARLNKIEMTQVHLDAICQLDNIWFNVYSTKNK